MLLFSYSCREAEFSHLENVETKTLQLPSKVENSLHTWRYSGDKGTLSGVRRNFSRGGGGRGMVF